MHRLVRSAKFESGGLAYLFYKTKVKTNSNQFPHIINMPNFNMEIIIELGLCSAISSVVDSKNIYSNKLNLLNTCSAYPT